MRYTASVFFDGPRSTFSDRLHPMEITFTAQARWLWLARRAVLSNLGNTGRLGYAITEGEKTIEEVRAPIAYVQPE